MKDDNLRLKTLPGYQIKIWFPNGSEAIIDMKKRTRGIRFGRLADIALFSTARIYDGEVVWDDGETCIKATINELLDSMQMD